MQTDSANEERGFLWMRGPSQSDNHLARGGSTNLNVETRNRFLDKPADAWVDTTSRSHKQATTYHRRKQLSLTMRASRQTNLNLPKLGDIKGL